MAGDRAGQDYWAQGWEGAPPRPLQDLDQPSIKNAIDVQYLKIFRKVFQPGKKMSVIELGCGNSIWLAYFKKYFDADIYGLDYTDTGCRTAQAILDANGMKGEIINGDIFNPSPTLKDKFDIVYTNGVVEHFEDTADCLRHCVAFARPGGTVVTFIPNLAGWIGAGQKRLDKAIYDIHVPQDLEHLKQAHEKAGLTVIEGDYLMPLNLYMMNTSKFKDKPWYPLIRAAFALPTRAIWTLEFMGLRLPANRTLSSYIYVLARKPV